jgi:signal transduction histidine kinase
MKKLNGWQPVVILFGIALLGSAVQCSPAMGGRSWQDALPGLYYLPIVIAAINLGVRVAVSVALASGLAHALAAAIGCGDHWLGPLTETMLYVVVGITAAKLSRVQESLGVARHGLAKTAGGSNGENGLQVSPGSRQISALNLAGLVHRFRTPVSSIEGAVWLLEDGRFPAEKREEFVRIIQRESHQLDRALSDVQEYTQPRKPRFQRVDLSELVDQVIQRAGPKDGPYFLLRTAIEPNLPSLSCDREQISKMLLNLLINAIQATPAGGQVSISAQAEGDRILITITDCGKGIPGSIAGKIFDPFFTTGDKGLGLGLTVARQIVTAHCGNIKVDGSSEKGTSVSVQLPVNPRDQHEQRSHPGG